MEENKERWVFIESDGVQFDITELRQVRQDAVKAKQFLRLIVGSMTPDKIHEILHLRTSRATLGRKLRAASRGENPELVRSYYVNERGTKIAQYSWNPEAK
jgi:hypothetical protein